ncbi:hypothetical protein HYC85_011165, partial [Camellia sinensis]
QSLSRQILVAHSRFFAVKLSDRWSKQQRTSNPYIVEIADCDDVEVYIEALSLMYFKDLRKKLMKEDVTRVLGILKLMHRNANQGLRYVASTQNSMDPSIVPQGLMAPMMPLPFDVSGMSTTPLDVHHPGPVPMSTLASALASVTLENQCMMLGEQLFPLVERVEPDHAGKVTGMLLEMDQTEVLHLIEAPDALKKKVSEALGVLYLTSSRPNVGD